MRIFLTGGTGHIGRAVLASLVRAGHHVDALVRDRERAARVAARGAHPVLGDLAQPATYAEQAAVADGVVHTAYERSPRGVEIDGCAVEALLGAVDGRDRFFIYTSGIWVLGSQPAPADEATPTNPAAVDAWRPEREVRVLAAGAGRLRTAVIRPGIVYGGSTGIVCDLLKDAANGLVRIVGPGDNRWPLVYERDLGELYLRVAATPTASGVFHASDEGDERVNDLVAALAGHVPVRPSVRRVPLAEARKKLGPVADALALDQIIRCPRSHALGWHPTLHSVSGNVARLFEEWRRGKDKDAA